MGEEERSKLVERDGRWLLSHDLSPRLPSTIISDYMSSYDYQQIIQQRKDNEMVKDDNDDEMKINHHQPPPLPSHNQPSMRWQVNINCQDNMGETPLHKSGERWLMMVDICLIFYHLISVSQSTFSKSVSQSTTITLSISQSTISCHLSSHR